MKMASDPGVGSETFERMVTARIAAAGIRLRYDKVALRLINGVRAGISQGSLDARSIIFAVTAPIKQPARTIAALTTLLPNAPLGGLRTTVRGNDVQARLVLRASTDAPRIMGFVHSPEHDVDLILNLAETSFSHD